jgi:hypothetical protein
MFMQRALLHAESRACAAAAVTTTNSSATDGSSISSGTESSDLTNATAGDSTVAIATAVSDDFPSIIEAAKSIVPDPAAIWT